MDNDPILTEEEKLEVANIYGPATKQALRPVTELLGELLAQHDILGLTFVLECMQVLCVGAIKKAEGIQMDRNGGSLH